MIKKSNQNFMATEINVGPWSTVRANWPNMLVWLAVFLLGLAVGKWVL